MTASVCVLFINALLLEDARALSDEYHRTIEMKLQVGRSSQILPIRL